MFSGIGSYASVLEAGHRAGRVLDRGVAAGRRARGDRPEHRRPERRRLIRCADPERPAGDVGVDLQDQRALLGEAAAGDDLVDRDAVGLEGLDDHPGAVRGRLDQRAVDLLGCGREGHADQQAADLGVDQDGSVAVPPVEREEPGLADALPARLLLQERVDVDAAGPGLGVVRLRQAVLDEPLEVIADARLAGLVAEEARDDAVLDAAAHARAPSARRARGPCGRWRCP